MKKINTYILEKFKITKNIKIEKEKYYILPIGDYNQAFYPLLFNNKYLLTTDKDGINCFLYSLDELIDISKKEKNNISYLYIDPVNDKMYDKIDDIRNGKIKIKNWKELTVNAFDKTIKQIIDNEKY